MDLFLFIPWGGRESLCDFHPGRDGPAPVWRIQPVQDPASDSFQRIKEVLCSFSIRIQRNCRIIFGTSLFLILKIVRYDCCPYPYVNLNFLFRWDFRICFSTINFPFTVCVGSMWLTRTLAELTIPLPEAENYIDNTSFFGSDNSLSSKTVWQRLFMQRSKLVTVLPHFQY